MTEDEILDAIDRRFAAVETRLPPTRVVMIDGPPTSTIARGRAMRPRAWPAAMVMVAVAAIAVAVGARMSGGIPGAARTQSSSSPAASVAPPTFPPASRLPSEAPLLVLRGATDGSALLMQHFGWGPTLCGGVGSLVAFDGAAVDRAVEEAGTEEGFVQVSSVFTRDPAATARFWVGPTAESAALGYGSRILAIGGRGDTWIVLGVRGWQMVPFPTPKGRTFWTLTGTIADGAC